MYVYGFFTLRRLRLLSGIVMFAYIAIHLLNHGLGIISLAVAETGLRFEMVFWRTLASGFSFPLLLINHAVTTRLGDALFAITPSYSLIIANLLAAGRQGMQVALLAPGWLHGCLGLWITLRRFRAMQKIKPLLVALVILIPLFAAAGFLRMASEVLAIWPRLPTGSDALLHNTVLASWNAYLVKIYLGAIFSAFLFGHLNSFWARLIRAVPRVKNSMSANRSIASTDQVIE